MNDEQSRAALASLAGPLAMPDAEAYDRQSGHVLPHLRQLVRGIPAQRRRKIWQRRVVAAGSVAVISALACAVWVRLAAPPAPFEVEQGVAASQGDEHHGYSTGAVAGASLRTRLGAHVSLTANTRLSAVSSEPQHELLHLASGSLSVRVPKLGTGATFAVQTPDSVVTVHGTVFSVTVVAGDSGSETCVTVNEGLVAVEHSGKRTLVGAGGQHNCRPQLAAPSLPALEPSTALSAAVTATSSPPPATPHEPRLAAKPSSTLPSSGRDGDESLAAQNRLLATALQAERAGRFAEARSQLQELLSHYPASPLRPDAERSLARVSRKIP